MNVSLTPELTRLVEEKVESGLYNSASEVVRAALRLLQEEDEERRIRLNTLRHEVQIGDSQLDRGEYSSYDSATEMMDAITSRVHARHANAQKPAKVRARAKVAAN